MRWLKAPKTTELFFFVVVVVIPGALITEVCTGPFSASLHKDVKSCFISRSSCFSTFNLPYLFLFFLSFFFLRNSEEDMDVPRWWRTVRQKKKKTPKHTHMHTEKRDAKRCSDELSNQIFVLESRHRQRLSCYLRLRCRSRAEPICSFVCHS